MYKNICLIIDSLVGGGAERIVLTLATTLSKLGHRVDVIVLSSIVSYPLDKVNFRVHILKKKKHPIRFIQKLKRSQDLQKKIEEINIKFDCFISNLPSADEICKQANLPNLYFVIHNTLSLGVLKRYKNNKGLLRLKRKIKYPFLLKQLYKNQNLITVSNGVKKDLVNFGIKAKTVQTIYNPFDFIDIAQQAKEYEVNEKDYIVHVGSFSQQKRHDILIKAYHHSGIKEKLLLLGEMGRGYIKQATKMQQLVSNLNLENKVIFKEFNANPYPYIKSAKALVLSSDFEGLPTVLVEALILGVPVVSTDCPSGPSEILIDELAEFLSPVGNINALAKNIKKVIQNPPIIKKQYFEKFSTEICARHYLSLCEDN